MLIRFDQVKISFGATDVLNGASFQIDPGERIGLIGRNGTGKTTILRLIAGSLTPDHGSVFRSSELQISYLEQLVHAESSGSVLESAESVFVDLLFMERDIEALNHKIADGAGTSSHEEDLSRLSALLHQFELHGGYSFRARAERVLMGLGFSKADFTKRCDEISGGQLNRLNLARVLLSEPNLLLLDEPTNHLDLDAIAWLEDFLRNYPRSFLVVSHDRYFLNKVVNRIFELERGVVISYTGNYSAYQVQRALRLEQETKAYEQQREWIERTQDFVRRNIAGQKTKQAQSRRKMLERTERLERPAASTEAARFDFHVTLPSAHQVLIVEDGKIGYEMTEVTRGINLKIYRGDRYGIIGKNGAGKSTFLKTACGRLSSLSGAWILGERVHLGYYDQTLENLNPSNTVIEELGMLVPAATDGELRSFAARILFKGEEVFQRIENLSGGEKSRLSLAKLICQHPNLLLLDEPTNHLDLTSREALEEALTEYDGTLLVATHDRYLLEKLVTRLLVFENGAVVVFDGTYSDYVRMKGSEATVGEAAKVPSATGFSDGRIGERLSLADVPATNSDRPQSPRKPNTNRERQRIQDLARVEDEIAKLEEDLREVEACLADSASYSDTEQIRNLSESYQSLTDHIKSLYDEWAALAIDET